MKPVGSAGAAGLAAMLISLGAACVFESLTLMETQDRAIWAASPWREDPYHTALSVTQWVVPVLALVICLRLFAWRASGGPDRTRQLARAAGTMTALTGLTLLAEWAAVVDPPSGFSWTPLASMTLAGLAVTSVVTTVAAALLLHCRVAGGWSGRWQQDWLDDLFILSRRIPGLRRWVTADALDGLRSRAMTVFVLASVSLAAAIAAAQAIGEHLTDPLIIAWYLVAATAANLACCVVGNAVAGFIARPPRARSRRVAEASVVTGCLALVAAIAFHDALWHAIGSGSLTVPALAALTIGVGVVTSLVTAVLLAATLDRTNPPRGGGAAIAARPPGPGRMGSARCLPVQVLYRLYAHRIRRQLTGCSLPQHVGVIMDGNRRWARRAGLASPSLGHRHGADHIDDLLHWCTATGITHVTVFVCSTENLTGRDAGEVAVLMTLMQELADRVREEPHTRWQLHLAGQPDVLPDQTAAALTAAVTATRTCRTGNHLTLAIGYGGRQELIDAVRDLLRKRAAEGRSLEQVAQNLTGADIAGHLYTAGQPEPDLVIRTSGEQRLSNFLLWQSAYSELYFCDAYWPAFREIDFLRALRSYAGRQRRYGR